MAYLHLLRFAEPLGEMFGKIHRAMLAAGTADGDGQRATIVAHEFRQPAHQQLLDVVEHGLNGLPRIQKLNHFGVFARERAQLRIVIGIGQRAHVEYKIGIARQAVLETKRLEKQREFALIQRDEISHPGAQGIGTQIAGVDVVRDFGNAGQNIAFPGDAFLQGALVVGERMRAARFGKTLDDGFGIRFQKQRAGVDALLDQSLDHCGQAVDAGAAAHVDT